MNSIELFAGAGGLALAAGRAGFSHECVIEWDRDACDTIRANQRRGNRSVAAWKLLETDVRAVDFKRWQDKVDMVAGGPPCQPFSIGGKHKGLDDRRNMFPEAIRAIREVRPKAFVFENVRGLLRQSFASFFEHVFLQLSYPTVLNNGEDWREHLSRLERVHTSGGTGALEYRVSFRVLNAADYGVPQKRERVFVVGFRKNIEADWSFPEPTHSEEALLQTQSLTGEYWEKYQIGRRDRRIRPSSLVADCRSVELFEMRQPWNTVRDAIHDLGNPQERSDDIPPFNHKLQNGARTYPGHTGSPLDEPAKTLKAGDHGVPGGENMIRFPDGSVRYFTVRESARLQTFSDDFRFETSWTESMRQLGNAVPVKLGEVIFKKVREVLKAAAPLRDV